MSVVVFIEVKNKVNKAALEAVSYGSKLGPVTVITYGTASEEALSELGDYGAENIWVSRKITENNDTNEKNLEELIKEFHNVDIVVVEGFKKEKHPKIEILGEGLKNKNKEASNVIAIVSDELQDKSTPVFTRNDTKNLVKFIIKKIL